MSEREVKDVFWFNGSKPVGVVVIDDKYDGRKAYIGVGDGLSEHADTVRIMNWGTKLPVSDLKRIIESIES